ncbi:MAG: DinB family protein [Pyrinomonadaceae bacterium]|nr:DinB family protein [Pyrinomonadaceae bacterium]
MQQQENPTNSLMTEDGALVAELQEREIEIEAIKQKAQDLIAGLNDRQFNWQPDAGVWSIAECLTHLNVTNNQYLPVIKNAIERGRASGLYGRAPFHHGFLGNWFVRLMEPPPKRKFKAPKVFTPPRGETLESVTPEFMRIQNEISTCIRRANGSHLAKIKIASPASKLLRLSLGQSFALLGAHERRHLWQAQQVKNHPSFPAT